MSLFESRPPLAERARPNSLDEIFGHENIIGKNLLSYGDLPAAAKLRSLELSLVI